MFIVGQIKCSWLIPHEQAICFSSLIWLSRNKSVKKSRFSRMVKNSREFSLLDLDLEAFWFHFSLLEKEWKHFDFTLHFSKKSESIFFHFALLEKEWKLFVFTFHFSNFKNPLSLVPAEQQKCKVCDLFLRWKRPWFTSAGMVFASLCTDCRWFSFGNELARCQNLWLSSSH